MTDFRTLGDTRSTTQVEERLQVEMKLLGNGGSPTKLDTLLQDSVGNFLLYEYWQLRTEIRERMSSVRTLLAVTFGGVSAVLTLTATLLSQQPTAPLVALSFGWLAAFGVLVPLLHLITSEQLSIVAISKYIRLHIETPFFEFGLRNLDDRALRFPVGWETYLLDVRRQAHRWGVALKIHKKRQRRDGRDPWDPLDSGREGDNDAIKKMVAALNDDRDLAEALSVSNSRDDFARRAITWTFRSLSTVAIAFSLSLASLAFYTGQPFANSLYLSLMIITNLTAFYVMHLLCGWYKDATRMARFADLPGMDHREASRFVVISKDGHKTASPQPQW